ncbi:MAG: metallophosphoesterase [Planctomycetes bacterium]|nr:metallophosphoesterase [Planctomycetota bacterium]MBL7044461.1 metallophosphoesterase [Pirellulaceae bacterium]
MSDPKSTTALSRRQFIKGATIGFALGWTGCSRTEPRGNDKPQTRETPKAGPFRFGVLTDVHYADADTKGTRHYRDSLEKLRQAIDTFKRLGVAFVVQLGDLVDAGGSKEDELVYLRTIDEVYGGFHGDRHYVLGNHCLNAFTKETFLAACSATTKQSYYSFDSGGRHFVVLDANFNQDGSPFAEGNYKWEDSWIPESEQQWLQSDLAAAGDKKTIVFIHQELHDETKRHGVKNAADVRRILEAAGNVVAVFQGHDHSGGYTMVAGIDYFTLKAMVEGPFPENNSYTVVTLDPSGQMELDGYGQQEDAATDDHQVKA